MSLQVTVEYFAAARELAGTDRELVTLEQDPCSTAAFLSMVARRHPRLAPVISRMRLAINGELSAGGQVCGGDEVAILPPVAGGVETMLCDVRDSPLSVDEVLNALRDDAVGGVALFLGVVRDHADGKQVARLDYEAHPTLAVREMRRVLLQVAAERPGVRLAALHREGQLSVGDTAIVVGAAAAHRAEAFAACREAVDRIKETAPIWKKEWAPDGTANWVNLEEP